ncbi:glycine zipper 2TM domain-containing protein [Vibrio sp. RC27]
MKTLTTAFTVTTALITICLSPTVMAKRSSHYDYARVVKATPVYEHIRHRVPVETCRKNGGSRHLSNPKHTSVGPAIVGGVIGGTVGHAIGSNRANKQVGLIAGSIIGATIGANISHGNGHHSPSRHCSTSFQVNHERVLVGYDVTYRYNGHRYHTHTKHHPGKRIQVPFQKRHHKQMRRHSSELVFKQKHDQHRAR